MFKKLTRLLLGLTLSSLALCALALGNRTQTIYLINSSSDYLVVDLTDSRAMDSTLKKREVVGPGGYLAWTNKIVPSPLYHNWLQEVSLSVSRYRDGHDSQIKCFLSNNTYATTHTCRADSLFVLAQGNSTKNIDGTQTSQFYFIPL